LDVLTKFVNLKAMLPSQGSLMNFLALMIEQHHPTAMAFAENWVAVWVAGDITFKQLQTEVNQLEAQINKVSMELNRLKQGCENPGLDGTLEDINGPMTKPLHDRLSQFLQVAKPQLQTMKESTVNVETTLGKLMIEFGENLKGTVEGDPAKRFFTTMVEFARAFQAAHDDNVAKLQAQEKINKTLSDAESKSSNKPLSLASVAKVAVAATHGTTPPENLFGRFHQAQNASAGDVLAEFKSKMNKRLTPIA
jgi:hypothetical protein